MPPTVAHSFFPPATPVGIGPRRWQTPLHFFFLLCVLAALYQLRFHGPSVFHRFLEPAKIQSISGVALLLTAAIAAIVLHEAGHLLAAWAFGFQLMGVTIGPWRVQMLHGKRKVMFLPQRWLQASVSAVPDRIANWRSRMLTVVAAGPLVSLFTSLSAFFLATHISSDNGPWLVFLNLLAQVNGILFILGLVPNAVDAPVRNDARMFLMLTQGGNALEEIALTVELTLLLLKGSRPQDYPTDLLLRLVKWRGRPEGELSFASAMVRWAMDSDEHLLVESWDARALALSRCCDERLRNQTLASSACIDVLFRDDLDSARIKFQSVNTKALFPKCFEYRCRAARQIALGGNKRAGRDILRAQYSLPRGIVAYDLERKLLENLHLRVLTADGRKEKMRRAACTA